MKTYGITVNGVYGITVNGVILNETFATRELAMKSIALSHTDLRKGEKELEYYDDDGSLIRVEIVPLNVNDRVIHL